MTMLKTGGLGSSLKPGDFAYDVEGAKLLVEAVGNIGGQRVAVCSYTEDFVAHGTPMSKGTSLTSFAGDLSPEPWTITERRWQRDGRESIGTYPLFASLRDDLEHYHNDHFPPDGENADHCSACRLLATSYGSTEAAPRDELRERVKQLSERMLLDADVIEKSETGTRSRRRLSAEVLRIASWELDELLKAAD